MKSIEEYLKEKRLHSSGDPLMWWRENGAKFLDLSKVAKRFLSCPPSSVPSEQLFSGAGIVYDDFHTSLLAEKAEKLLFIKYNLPLLGFEYGGD